MNTAVAVTDQICRTVLYLAAIAGGVKLAPLVLPRMQVTNPRGQRQPAIPPAAAVMDGHAISEAKP